MRTNLLKGSVFIMKNIELDDNEFSFLRTLLSNFIKVQPKFLLKNKKNFVDFLKKFELYL